MAKSLRETLSGKSKLDLEKYDAEMELLRKQSDIIDKNNDVNINLGNQVFLNNAQNNPIEQTQNNATEKAPRKISILEICSWIVGIIIGLIGIYEFIIKK